MKVKIIRLSKKDAHYHDRKELIGLTGKVDDILDMGKMARMKIDWKGIRFIPDEGTNPFHFSPIHFAYVEFEQVNDE